MRCSISECKNLAVQTVQISFKETRNLCKQHLEIFKNKEQKHPLNFSKASEFEI